MAPAVHWLRKRQAAAQTQCYYIIYQAVHFAVSGGRWLYTHSHMNVSTAAHTHTYKYTNLHLSMADSKLCLVIVYLTDAIDLTELEESL